MLKRSPRFAADERAYHVNVYELYERARMMTVTFPRDPAAAWLCARIDKTRDAAMYKPGEQYTDVAARLKRILTAFVSQSPPTELAVHAERLLDECARLSRSMPNLHESRWCNEYLRVTFVWRETDASRQP